MTRFELSDRQWRAIQQASGLPESARERIEHLLEYYRAFQQASATQPPAARTRRELIEIAELGEKLITAIIGVKGDARRPLRLAGVKPHVLAALMLPASRTAADPGDMTAVPLAARPGLRTPTLDALDQLYERVLTVEQLRLWFERAARSLPAETKGAHKAAENHRWLVGQLDAILAECTGGHINRSYKNDLAHYVELCFAAVDPNVGPGSINKVFEAYVRLNLPRRMTHVQIAKKSAQFVH
jgi:hypothetical protein